jgi:quercetin dioxygenase-like cupin family protein
VAELVEDPLFNQRYRFSRQGDVLRVEIWAEPDGGVTIEHFHPRLQERFEVFEGEVTFRVDGQERRAGPGDKLVAERGVRHSYKNRGPAVAHLAAEAEPALDLQESIEEAAAMARAGKFTPRGFPRGLRARLEAAEFADRYRETTLVTSPPLIVQRILSPPLVWLERRRRRRHE